MWAKRPSAESEAAAHGPLGWPAVIELTARVVVNRFWAQLFGTGETSIRTAQNLSLYSGLPPLVRTGDWYSAVFTLRNGSDHPMTVTASPRLEPAIAQAKPLTLTIPAGKAGLVRRVAQGLYYVPRHTPFGEAPPSEEELFRQEMWGVRPIVDPRSARAGRRAPGRVPRGPPAPVLPGPARRRSSGRRRGSSA